MAAAVATAVSAAVHADNDGDGRLRDPRPLVIGHRGASGYMPEHTLASYAPAIELGADYTEPDLVMTRDGELIARHEPNLTATTDVSQRLQFAGRFTTKVVDGVAEQGWFASDFTLAEIRRLRAVQTIPSEHFTGVDRQFPIPTFREVIRLAKAKSAEKGRTIGVYPETKHPTFHHDRNLRIEDAIVKALRSEGWNHEHAPVFGTAARRTIVERRNWREIAAQVSTSPRYVVRSSAGTDRNGCCTAAPEPLGVIGIPRTGS
jgi:glycerophosphoryl diester phosphodiesterase